ncbi:aspartate-alanine antiporter [Flavihumibacter rivuli]|uniref:aspartate-alanine antiporter n=1 Tax=Flavihumibacter rivuli TaxID=2838156 RepID=UPI001BDEE927|nr:aspartate-alanine antiporter [Flavihumibacter rivuli]ULQ55795.1 aspartate-alanine antiporter [Flavihumibacter rivuli]
MDTIATILREHPELAVFLTLGFGFLIGRIRIGSFQVGAMLGTLFAGMVVGQLTIEIPEVVKIIFFDLFLFATGYKVGPQFFYGLRKDALPMFLLTIVVCVGCLVTAILVSKFLGYDVGTAAGILAGAFSESTVIGTASESIKKLAISPEEQKQLINNIPIAYAVAYLVGTTSLVWFLSNMAPKLLGIDLKKECAVHESTMISAGTQESDEQTALKEWSIRSIQLDKDHWVGKSIGEAERSFPGKRIVIHRLRRLGAILEPGPELVLQEGDILAIAARQGVILDIMNGIGKEVMDRKLLDYPMREFELVVKGDRIVDKTLKEIATTYGEGVLLEKITRAGQELPFQADTVVHAGDVLTIYGRKEDVDRLTTTLGVQQLKGVNTDISFVSLGIVLGGLVGLLATSWNGITITLSTSGGALVMGLVFGWIHSRTPKYGNIPEAALWIFDNLGLATFLGIVGLSAGPSFISGLQHTGWQILPAGLVVALVPHIIGLYFGRYVLKMNPAILLGAQSGAGTTTIGLKAIQDAAGSKVPVLGYTIPYALGNILLTAWGPVIVSIMTRP